MPDSTTIASIAEAAGVAKSTVSLALRNSPKVVEKTRLRIQGLARNLDYRPNPLVTAQMAHIRLKNKRNLSARIGYLSTWPIDSDQKRKSWNVIGRFYEGARARAKELGFDFELFEFDLTKYSTRRIQQILYSRNIEGLVLAPLRSNSTQLEMDWSNFSLAAIGYYKAFGNIHRVFYDNFHCMHLVFGRLLDLGYKRIGFITNLLTDEKAGYHWTGAFLDYQTRVIPVEDQVPLLRMKAREVNFGADDFEEIHDWYQKNKPDVIISYLDCVYQYFKSLGYKIPEEVGFMALTWTDKMADCSGYNQSQEKVGATAVDVVVDGLYRNARGMPKHSTTTMLEGKFIEGDTLGAQFETLAECSK